MTTLPAGLLQRAERTPDQVALRRKALGRWHEYTWADWADRAARIGLGLRELGVSPGDAVVVVVPGPEGLFLAAGAQGIGAVLVSVDPRTDPAEVARILVRSDPVAVIVAHAWHRESVAGARPLCPRLRCVVSLDPRSTEGTSLADIEGLAGPTYRADFATAVAGLDPSGVATVVHGPGPVPAALALRHAELAAEATARARQAGLSERDELLASGHGPAAIELATAVHSGSVLNLGEGLFASDIRDVQPTVLHAPAATWTAIHDRVQGGLQRSTWLKRRTLTALTRPGRRPTRLGWLLLHRSLRDKLGLRRLRLGLSDMELPPGVADFFRSLGLAVGVGEET